MKVLFITSEMSVSKRRGGFSKLVCIIGEELNVHKKVFKSLLDTSSLIVLAKLEDPPKILGEVEISWRVPK